LDFWNKNIIDNPEIMSQDFNWEDILDNPHYGWERFVLISGTPWKTVIEVGIGKITPEEIQKIKNMDITEEIVSPKSIKILRG
jgi:hypothetical protein